MNKEDVIEITRMLYKRNVEIEQSIAKLNDQLFDKLYDLDIFMCIECTEIFNKPIDFNKNNYKHLFCSGCLGSIFKNPLES